MKKSDTYHFDAGGFQGDVYIGDDDKKGFNALRVSVTGEHPTKTLSDTTRVYLVISGQGTFTINDETEEVTVDNLYIIEPGSSYSYQGEMELFEFNVSPNNIFK